MDGLFHNGAMPALERLVQFTEKRQAVLAHNVANLSTPRFRPTDLDVDAFQAALGRAIDQRRTLDAPHDGPLELRSGRAFTFRRDGLDVHPRPLNENVLFHDENNRDLERMMQDVAENQMVHAAGVRLLKNQFDLLEVAIREQP